MGLKRTRGQSQAAIAAVVEPEPELGTAGLEIEAEQTSDATPGPRRGRKPGQTQERGPQLEWTDDRQLALIRMLKSPKAPGTIRTAQSVADALAQDPAFEGETLLTPERVKSFVARAVKDLETAGRPVPEYLTLDRARRVVVNLALFELEDETEDAAGTEDETVADGEETETED